MSLLFQPWDLGGLRLSNRIVIAPMCQYSAADGVPGDWHMVHLGHLAHAGAGLFILEATAVTPDGRITPWDLGLYNDEQEVALARILQALQAQSPISWGMQLAHAGRKASSQAPWQGGAQIPLADPLAWQAVAPSALPHGAKEEPPTALDREGLKRIREGFAQAARRAARIGIESLEIHAAHGYLLHQFLSPLANQRTDEYGGSLENRMRFPLEVFDAVREAFRNDRPVWARLSATDWVPGGWDVEDSVALGLALKARGCSALHVSSAGVSPRQQIPLGPGYQVPLAQRLKQACGLPTIAVGLITEPAQAEAILADGQADAVALARGLLYNPRWPWHAAAALGASVDAPHQYWRSQPREHPQLFRHWHFGAR